MKFQILEHTSDLKIKSSGKDLPELFRNLAYGMFTAALGSKIQEQKLKRKKRKIKITASDSETLLINFLNELIYLSDINNEIYLDFIFKEFGPKSLTGIVYGQPIPESGFKFEIKGATFHNLKIQKTKKGYEVTVLFDI